MAKILLAWEAGAHLGHDMLVTAAGVLMQRAGHDAVICAPHGRAPNPAAAAVGIRWEQMPAVQAPNVVPAGVAWESRATTLWNFGFHSREHIGERFLAWSGVLAREAPDVVVLQAAPFAQLAAHAAGRASVEFGIGFDVPPAAAPFPAFRNAAQFDAAQASRLEAGIVANVVDAVGAWATGRALHQLVCGAQRLVTSIPEVDHYGGERDAARRFIGPLPVVPLDTEHPAWQAGRGPRVLAYVRAAAVDVPAFFRAVQSLGGEAVVVCTGADDAQLALGRSLGLQVHATPVSLEALLPEADLVISHGGGMLAEALVRGRPCVALPSHFEQFLASTNLRRGGLGVMVNPHEPSHYAPAMRHVLNDSGIRRNVAAVADRHAAEMARRGQAFVETVESLLETA